uniref:Uncharacterized protein n=1 Tax=Opuntia streptacantha TaxID=393608 RepID=A0A7C9EDI8_OPUST
MESPSLSSAPTMLSSWSMKMGAQPAFSSQLGSSPPTSLRCGMAAQLRSSTPRFQREMAVPSFKAVSRWPWIVKEMMGFLGLLIQVGYLMMSREDLKSLFRWR